MRVLPSEPGGRRLAVLHLSALFTWRAITYPNFVPGAKTAVTGQPYRRCGPGSDAAETNHRNCARTDHHDGRSMKTLIVADFFPWPSTGGGLLRLAKSIEALSELGEVDLFSFYDTRRPDRIVPPTLSISRVCTSPYPEVGASLRWRSSRLAQRGASLRWRAAWLAQRGAPMEITMRRFDKTPREAFESWVADRYDLAWFNTIATFEWLGRPRVGPTVIDIDNLESEKEVRRGRLMREGSSGHGVVGSMHRAMAIAQSRLNARDWKNLERTAAGIADRVALCSELDVQRSGLGNAEIVANSYQRPLRACGRLEVSDPPVVLFQGSLNYAPNVDAATWLVRDLAPRLRSRVPGTEIRLVGTTTPGLERLHDPPGVTVVGRVPDMEPELARADIAVVPLRYGSGTRLKILESFAHRIPVVSTTMGAEGLDVEPGVHLLVADDPDGFVAACERLLTEVDLRKRIVDAAEERYLECYESSSVKEQIQALATGVAAVENRS